MIEQTPIHILVISSRASTLEDIARICKANDRLVIVGYIKEGTHAVQIARLLLPEIVLLDRQMKGVTDLAVLQSLKENLPHLLTIMMSTSNETAWLREAIALGAVHFLMKPLDEQEVVNAIEAAYRRGIRP